ncbi:MAG: toll/interleukin-1 receptor domain-containing protein [Gammaproteobacteria bacterium]|nr:toll/interleukin-1 receptor domain-containing protein [Gammaproteobacteria bacterium]
MAKYQNSPEIFLLFVSEDRERVRPIAEAGESLGAAVWWDFPVSPSGIPIDAVVHDALERSHCVVAIWSLTSVGSKWVQTEAYRALERDRLISVVIDQGLSYPLLLDPATPRDLCGWNGDPSAPAFREFEESLLPLLKALSESEGVDETTQQSAEDFPGTPIKPAPASSVFPPEEASVSPSAVSPEEISDGSHDNTQSGQWPVVGPERLDEPDTAYDHDLRVENPVRSPEHQDQNAHGEVPTLIVPPKSGRSETGILPAPPPPDLEDPVAPESDSRLPRALREQLMLGSLEDKRNGVPPPASVSPPFSESTMNSELLPLPSAPGLGQDPAGSKQRSLAGTVFRYALLAGSVALAGWMGFKLFPLFFGMTGSVKPGRREDSAEDTEPVDCSVFGPPKLALGQQIMIQVFLHPPESADAAEAGARQFDSDAEKRGFCSLNLDLTRGSRVVVQLDAGDLHVSDDGCNEIRWSGGVIGTSFLVSAPEGVRPGKKFGTVHLSVDGVPAGKIHFVIKLKSQLGFEELSIPLGDSAHRYRKAFISYASENRGEVLKRVQTLGALKIDYFQDVLDLEPGERWEKRLYQEIQECDLFMLFWSEAARDSEWVYKEALYALDCRTESSKDQPVIVPVVIDGPPAPAPWSELEELHFNDRLIYLLRPGSRLE